MDTTRWHKIRALTAGEFWFLLQSTLMLPVIALGLRLKGYQRTKAILERYIPNPPVTTATVDPEKIARIVSISANHSPYRANCLKKALLTWWWLARRNISSEIILGVNRDEGEFNAHAWVEVGGHVLQEGLSVRERFTQIATQANTH